MTLKLREGIILPLVNLLWVGRNMIEIEKLNGCRFLINQNLIETIEFIPETKVTLTTGKYYLIKDSKDEIQDKILKYSRRVFEDKIVIREVREWVL